MAILIQGGVAASVAKKAATRFRDRHVATWPKSDHEVQLPGTALYLPVHYPGRR